MEETTKITGCNTIRPFLLDHAKNTFYHVEKRISLNSAISHIRGNYNNDIRCAHTA